MYCTKQNYCTKLHLHWTTFHPYDRDFCITNLQAFNNRSQTGITLYVPTSSQHELNIVLGKSDYAATVLAGTNCSWKQRCCWLFIAIISAMKTLMHTIFKQDFINILSVCPFLLDLHKDCQPSTMEEKQCPHSDLKFSLKPQIAAALSVLPPLGFKAHPPLIGGKTILLDVLALHARNCTTASLQNVVSQGRELLCHVRHTTVCEPI